METEKRGGMRGREGGGLFQTASGLTSLFNHYHTRNVIIIPTSITYFILIVILKIHLSYKKVEFHIESKHVKIKILLCLNYNI